MITGPANTSTGRLSTPDFQLYTSSFPGRAGSRLSLFSQSILTLSSQTTPLLCARAMATITKTATDAPVDGSLLDKLDDLVPAPLAQFDAFPKLPSTYKARSESRGFLTIFVAFAAFLLVLNDLGEYIWGWPDHEFGVDIDKANTMDINVDMVVNMPCQCECSCFLLCLDFVCM